MTLITFLVASLIMTWIGSKSSYWILKSLAGVLWFAVLAMWLNGSRPDSIVAGTPADQIVVLFLIAMGIAVFFMPMWFIKDEAGGRFKNPFKSKDDEEETMQARYIPTREERIEAYRQRTRNAINGK